MHFYNLPIFKVSQTVINTASTLRKNRNVRALQSASVKDNLFYNCCITADDKFYVRKINFELGTVQEKHVKAAEGKIEEIFVCGQQVIMKMNSNQIICIQAETIFDISQQSLIKLGKHQFNCFSLGSAVEKRSKSKLKFIKVEQDLIMVHLLEQNIAFQNLAPSSHRKWAISAWDLGYGRNDKIVDFQVKGQSVLGVDSQRQLILAVVKILQENGDEVYVLLQMLWNQSRYVSSQIYVCYSEVVSQPKQSHIQFTVFSSLLIVVYTGGHLLICKRLQEGIQVELILAVYQQIIDIINIQNYSYDRELIAVCKNKNKIKIYRYNIDEMLNNLVAQPKIINCDVHSQGQVIGFVKLPSCNPLLVFTDRSYLLMPTMLTLYQTITTIREQEQLEQQQIQDYLFAQQDTDSYQVQLLSFSSFYKMFHKNSGQFKQAVEELFLVQKMNKIVQQFQQGLQRQIGCYKNDTSLCWNALQRQYTSIFIYLLQFLHYIQHQIAQIRPLIILSDCYLLQIQHTFKRFYQQKPLVQQQKIQSVIHAKIIELKQNLSAFLILFSKTNQVSSTQQNSVYQYFQILKNLKMRQIVQFVVNKISLIDYLAFFIYQAALLTNTLQWKMGRSLLRRVIEIGKDYPPLIGLLCGDIDQYTRSYQELEFCKLLTLQQQREELVLQNLPSLKQTIVAAPYYLKKIGFTHLLCFVPDEYQKFKHDGNFIVLNIPKFILNQTLQNIRTNLIQIREKNYVFLTQENICKAIQSMEREPSINFCVQSRCEVFTFSQKLKVLNELLLLQLTRCFEEKCRNRLQKLEKYKEQIQYDFRCFSNSEYQNIIRSKKFNVRDLKFKQSKKQESHEQVSIIQAYYSNLLQLCETYNLQKFISHLRTNILMKSSIVSPLQKLSSLDISRISLQEKKQQTECNLSIFYLMLFINMWNLYQSMLYSQQTKFIHFQLRTVKSYIKNKKVMLAVDFEEQLQYSSFSQSYLSIMEFLSSLLETYCIRQVNKHQIQEVSVQKIKKSLLNKKGGIKFRNKSYNLNEKVVYGNLRTELVLKIFRQTRQWIFDFQQLLLQSILKWSMLTFKNKKTLSYLLKSYKI